jgi:hypothetical protein
MSIDDPSKEAPVLVGSKFRNGRAKFLFQPGSVTLDEPMTRSQYVQKLTAIKANHGRMLLPTPRIGRVTLDPSR